MVPTTFLYNLLFFLPIWVLYYLVIELPLTVLGIPIVYKLAKDKAWYARPSKFYPGKTILAWKPSWAWLWGNEEDGVTGAQWWHDKNPTWSETKLAFQWSALRNSVNNLRYVPGLRCIVNPSKVKVSRLGKAYIARQGVYAGLTYDGTTLGDDSPGTKGIWFHIGWKIFDTDVGTETRLPMTDMRYPGAGFGLRLKRHT